MKMLFYIGALALYASSFATALERPLPKPSPDLPAWVALDSGERKELTLSLDGREESSSLTTKLKITGDFGTAGEAVLSMQLIPSPPKQPEGAATMTPGAAGLVNQSVK